MNGSGTGNGGENGNENGDEGGGGREPGDLRSGNRGRSEYARRRVMSTSNQQLQPQDPTPQRGARPYSHHAEDQSPGTGNEGPDRGGRRNTKKRKKPHKSCRRDEGNRGDLCGKR